MKSVAGVPSLRPPWFFDIREQGEALSDVGTHLVDLAHWTAFPDEALDPANDIQMLDARRWPTTLSPNQWRKVTGTPDFPSFLVPWLKDGSLDYYCNTFVSYSVRGVAVQMNVLWDFEGPPASDTYFASFRGTNSRIEVRQGSPENFRPEVYVVPRTSALRDEVLVALREKIRTLQAAFDGLGLEEHGDEFRLRIPDATASATKRTSRRLPGSSLLISRIRSPFPPGKNRTCWRSTRSPRQASNWPEPEKVRNSGASRSGTCVHRCPRGRCSGTPVIRPGWLELMSERGFPKCGVLLALKDSARN